MTDREQRSPATSHEDHLPGLKLPSVSPFVGSWCEAFAVPS